MVERKPQALKYKELSNTWLTSCIFPVAPFSSHHPLHKSCPTHGSWLVDGGQNQFSASNLFFLNKWNLKNMAKINKIYQEIKIIFNYK